MTIFCCILQARLEQPLPWMCYSLSTYLAYVLYPPLYAFGPVLSYKSFASQLRSPKRTELRQVRLLPLSPFSLVSGFFSHPRASWRIIWRYQALGLSIWLVVTL